MNAPAITPRVSASVEVALDSVISPAGVPTGLSNDWYTADERFALERDVLFGRNWFAVGFEASVPNRGDTWPVDMFGMPLLLLRGEDGEAAVFHNVCSHRGMKLVSEPGNAGPMLRCPYHSWCYGLDGELKSTPMVGGPGIHEHPAVDRGQHGLRRVRSSSWLGVVFATLDDAAPDFDTYAAPLKQRWADFAGITPLASGPDSSGRLDVRSNWKLPVENFLEAYHLPWVHPELNRYSRLEDHELVHGDHGHAGQISHAYKPRIEGADAPFKRSALLPSRWDGRAEYMALFPNALLGVHADHYSHLLVQPVAPGVSIEHMQIYYLDESSLDESLASRRLANRIQWRAVFDEDVFAVEGMQAGRHSPGYGGGVITPLMEASTRDFHVWCAQQLRAAV